MTGKTVYRLVGDKVWWALAIVMLGICFAAPAMLPWCRASSNSSPSLLGRAP